MDNISPHISYAEATFSETAIRKGMDNTPDEKQIANMKMLADNLIEPLRRRISKIRGVDTPIHISSFLRRPMVNAAVGGSKTSQHCAGEISLKEEAAVDVETNYADFTKRHLFYEAKAMGGFDQLIWEFGDDDQPAWVHMSYRKEGNRGEVLRAVVKGGITKYLPFE